MDFLTQLSQAVLRSLGVTPTQSDPSSGVVPPSNVPSGNPPAQHTEMISTLRQTYGLAITESDPQGKARPFTDDELTLLLNTTRDMGPDWYGLFLTRPVTVWVDRTPGGGSYGSGSLRLGNPGSDLSQMYRVFIHEGTHASNEYRKWPYETTWCTKPGFDWVKVGDNTWKHPRQPGTAMQAGNWETLPVDSRDVSTTPGEDLAETVRYFVHSVKNERLWLWPLDQSKPATYLWMTSPTRFVFVRDVFLKVPPNHPWYKRLSSDQEQLAAQHLGS